MAKSADSGRTPVFALSNQPVYRRKKSHIAMTEAEKLAAFLLALQTSPTQRERFELDPVGEMTLFDLDPKTISAVLDRQTVVLWEILDVPRIRHQQGVAAGVEKTGRRPKKKRP